MGLEAASLNECLNLTGWKSGALSPCMSRHQEMISSVGLNLMKEDGERIQPVRPVGRECRSDPRLWRKSTPVAPFLLRDIYGDRWRTATPDVSALPLDKMAGAWVGAVPQSFLCRGRSIVVMLQPSKLGRRVRFPLPAPSEKRLL